MIDETMITNKLLSFIKVILFLLNASYVVGMLWMILMEFIELEYFQMSFKDLVTEEQLKEHADYDKNFAGHWLTEYKLYWKPHVERAIIASYFAFTSLSTVGFGDYHPENEAECLFCAFILLFGVASFSYFMGTCIEILQNIIDFFQEDDFGEELTKFLSTLKKFNAGEPIK